jgi:hypothetical protein
MKTIFTLVTSFLIITNINAQTATWSDDVAKIIYTKCTGCHRQGGIGEVSGLYFNDYNQVVSNKIAIKSSVNSLRMPPWPADANYKHFVGEKSLTQTEISKINDFINNGTPQGNVANAPQAPVFSNADALPNPDYTVHTPSYTVQATGDEYRTFVLKADSSSVVKHLNKMEFKPGNSQIVHHILVYLDTTRNHLGRTADFLDAGEGFATNGTGFPVQGALFIAGWAPGSDYFALPPSIGLQIHPNSDYLIEFHYAPNSIGQTDSTKINFEYCKVANPRSAYVAPILSHTPSLMVGGSFFIPANTVTSLKQFNSIKKSIPSLPSFLNFSVFSVFPHMHKIGSSYKVYGTHRNNVLHKNDTTPYINIPRWDFNWQNSYIFKKPIKLPITDTLWGEATYNNTTSNPNNPSNPPINVHSGEKTTDEMMVTFLTIALYNQGDENMNVDSLINANNTTALNNTSNTTSNNSKVLIYPSVTTTTANLQINDDRLSEGEVLVRLYDAQGKEVAQALRMHSYKGYLYNSIDVHTLAHGTYTLRIHQDDKVWINKLVKE